VERAEAAARMSRVEETAWDCHLWVSMYLHWPIPRVGRMAVVDIASTAGQQTVLLKREHNAYL
jgi:hypothetical protein